MPQVAVVKHLGQQKAQVAVKPVSEKKLQKINLCFSKYDRNTFEILNIRTLVHYIRILCGH